jgi:hypothetical protein
MFCKRILPRFIICPTNYLVFEGNGKAALYTGDIRSEPWFVNKLTRNPFLIEYTSGLKSLDCIYLDTSNIDPISFPTKAAGLQELLDKVSKYPPGTIFHFEAWTFGYEEVWMALSKALKSPVSVQVYAWYILLTAWARSMWTPTNGDCISPYAGIQRVRISILGHSLRTKVLY